MSIYVFNLLVGYMPNGVDNAQGKRHQYLKKLGVPVQYVFTSMPTAHYINRYRKVGIPVENMLCMHLLHTNRIGIISETKYTAWDKVTDLMDNFNCERYQEENDKILLFSEDQHVITVNYSDDGKSFDSIDFFQNGFSIKTEFYYEGRLLYSEDFITVSGNNRSHAKTARRVFYNSDKTIAYEVIFQGDREKYIFTGGKVYSRSQFLELSFQKLELTGEDIILLDRFVQQDYLQQLLQNRGKAILLAFLHSEHYYLFGESDSSIGLNREYYNLFQYSREFSGFLVSTDSQKQELEECLKQYGCYIPPIDVIPISGIDRLRFPDSTRKEKTLLTVSRLDHRKRIEWLILAMAKVHQIQQDIRLDIYGKGNEAYTKKLKDMVKKLELEDSVCFRGYCNNVQEYYKDYEVYVSASLWETMGLSVMEAIGSGNAMIGLDAKYGNKEMIQNYKNGLLVEFDNKRILDSDIDEVMSERIAKAIIDIYEQEEKLGEYQKNSYEIAADYIDENIEKRWVKFLSQYLCESKKTE